MDRVQVIATLRAHESELKAAGIVRLSLFGSTARGEASQDSDVDIAVGLSEDFSTGGFDYFWRMEQLQEHLSRLLGCHVEVVAEPVRKASFQKEVDQDRALAF